MWVRPVVAGGVGSTLLSVEVPHGASRGVIFKSCTCDIDGRPGRRRNRTGLRIAPHGALVAVLVAIAAIVLGGDASPGWRG